MIGFNISVTRFTRSSASCMMVMFFTLMFCSCFIDGYARNGFPWGYCTWYAADKFDTEVPRPGLDWAGNGGQWYKNAKYRGWATSDKQGAAEKGALIVWMDSDSLGHEGYGHVAFVESVSNNTITISEMNWVPGGATNIPKIDAKPTTTSLSLSNLDRGSKTKYYFQGYIFPRKSDDQCFTGESGGTAIQYIQSQNPGGYNWSVLFPRKSDSQDANTSSKSKWIYPLQIWYEFQTASKGGLPQVNSVMVIESSNWGHVAIVTKIDGDKIHVRHSNWKCQNRELVTTGYFRLVEGGQRVTYNDGNETYRLIGYIYKPWGATDLAQNTKQNAASSVNKGPVQEKSMWEKFTDFFKQLSFFKN
jgi:surface antigen